MPHLKVFGRFLAVSSQLMLKHRRWLDDELFLQAAYRGLLNRDPDADGLDYYQNRLQRGSLSRLGVLQSIIQSSEFKQVAGLPVHPLLALHQSRMQLIRHHLPQADIIVDLGGASIGNPEGALLAMGYPHRPQKVMIIDLPPDDRLYGDRGAEKAQSYTTPDGVTVQYFYSSMTDMSPLADASVDFVWSGESIEHISEADGDIVCREAYRVLKPGGYFCLDTPNGRLTRIQSPDEFIHPEHQKEYLVHELQEKVVKWGFELLETRGICHMPQTVQSGHFDQREMAFNMGLFDEAEECYLFYLKARKPYLEE